MVLPARGKDAAGDRCEQLAVVRIDQVDMVKQVGRQNLTVAVSDLPLEAVHVGVEGKLDPLHRQADVRAVRRKVDGSDHELERLARMVDEREAIVAVDGHGRCFRTTTRHARRQAEGQCRGRHVLQTTSSQRSHRKKLVLGVYLARLSSSLLPALGAVRSPPRRGLLHVAVRGALGHVAWRHLDARPRSRRTRAPRPAQVSAGGSERVPQGGGTSKYT